MAGSIGTNDGANATFSFPVGIAADNAGNLYVADWGNDLIRKIDTNNAVSTVATGGYQFSGPSGVAIDSSSNLWVADTGNEVICMISNGAVTIVAGPREKREPVTRHRLRTPFQCPQRVALGQREQQTPNQRFRQRRHPQSLRDELRLRGSDHWGQSRPSGKHRWTARRRPIRFSGWHLS